MQLRDLKGQRFSRLVVLKRDGSNRHGNATWLCRCDCGEKVVVAGGHLNSGHSRSCGCLMKETVAELGLTSKLAHGHAAERTHTGTYHTWHAMKQRCLNENTRAYQYYGGRGITICDRWLSSFEAFLEDMGERPKGMTLDRIDPDGHYEPANSRWATREVQLKNRRPRARKSAPAPTAT